MQLQTEFFVGGGEGASPTALIDVLPDTYKGCSKADLFYKNTERYVGPQTCEIFSVMRKGPV